MHVDGVLAGGGAARIGHLVVHAGGVGALAQVVAQKIENHAALVGIADRDVARGLDPQVDVGIQLVRPAHLDDHVAWRLGVLLGGLAGRVEMGQQEQDHCHEAGQRQHDDIAEDRATLVLIELVKRVHGAPPPRRWQ